MPNKVITLHRWQAVGVLILITLSFVLATVLNTREGKRRSDANRDFITQIQRQRAEITYTTCRDQNDRHDNTVQRLDDRLRKRKAVIRKQIKESKSLVEQTALRAQIDGLDDARSFTVDLIDALQPHQNCDQLVIDRFGYVPDLGNP